MKKYIGDKSFYRLVLTLALPLLLQNAVSTFVNLLDNLMVGQTGTEPMSGVAIVNQLIFVYNLCLFGGVAGAGIFGAQFHGRGDWQGVRSSLRFNLILVSTFTVLATGLFLLTGKSLILAFLHDAGGGGDLNATLRYGEDYLRVMLWGLAPFAVTNAYTAILRVTGNASLPMRASITALGLNLLGNWLLIFGHWGLPAMGVRGAAVATVLSRYVEAALIVGSTHRQLEKYPFARDLFRSLRIPRRLTGDIMKKGFPLLINELFWSLGQTMLIQCYSYRGLTAVAALNINSVVLNLFNVVMITMGNCAGIILGNVLGSGDFERARSYCPKIMALSVVSCAVTGALLVLVSPLVPRFYNTTPEVMQLATRLMMVCGCYLPLHAITNIAYFTLRSGGRVLITVLFDSVFSWVFYIPVAWLLIHFTALPLLPVYIIVGGLDIIKAALGLVLVSKGIWIRNIIVKE